MDIISGTGRFMIINYDWLIDPALWMDDSPWLESELNALINPLTKNKKAVWTVQIQMTLKALFPHLSIHDQFSIGSVTW